MAEIIVPVLHFLDEHERIDSVRTLEYARRANATWVHRFIVAGSTAQGRALAVDQRAELLGMWAEVAGPDRLLGCIWQAEDREALQALGITAMAIMENLADEPAALSFLAGLPSKSTIYSHPMFGGIVFDASLAARATQEGVLPVGGKLAKVGKPEITAIRRVVDEGFWLWDGSCRDIAGSVAAGANGVVATPLCGFADDFPGREFNELQRYVTDVQTRLDALPSRAARTDWLLTAA